MGNFLVKEGKCQPNVKTVQLNKEADCLNWETVQPNTETVQLNWGDQRYDFFKDVCDLEVEKAVSKNTSLKSMCLQSVSDKDVEK